MSRFVISFLLSIIGASLIVGAANAYERKAYGEGTFQLSKTEARKVILFGDIRNRGFINGTHHLLVGLGAELFACYVQVDATPTCFVWSDKKD